MHYAPKDSPETTDATKNPTGEPFSASSLTHTVQDPSLHYGEKNKILPLCILNFMPQDLALFSLSHARFDCLYLNICAINFTSVCE